jgi:hypothetical protein
MLENKQWRYNGVISHQYVVKKKMAAQPVMKPISRREEKCGVNSSMAAGIFVSLFGRNNIWHLAGINVARNDMALRRPLWWHQ